MNLSNEEVKKVMYGFNCISNRLLKEHFQMYNETLKKFLSYIDSNELITTYVKNCGQPTYDVAQEVHDVKINYRSAQFSTGNSETEETANIYGVLKYIAENNIKVYERIGFSYTDSSRYEDALEAFNTYVVRILINNIEKYLTTLGIDMGLDANKRYNIQVENKSGQVNVTVDSSNVAMTQQMNFNQDELKKYIDDLRKYAPVDEVSKVIVASNIKIIEEEIKNRNNNKTILKSALDSLKVIKGCIEFGAAVANIAQFFGIVMF